jgi:hypothetical protein
VGGWGNGWAGLMDGDWASAREARRGRNMYCTVLCVILRAWSLHTGIT